MVNVECCLSQLIYQVDSFAFFIRMLKNAHILKELENRMKTYLSISLFSFLKIVYFYFVCCHQHQSLNVFDQACFFNGVPCLSSMVTDFWMKLKLPFRLIQES